MDATLVVSLGDPFSVNIELLAKQFTDLSPNTVLVGSFFHWEDQVQSLNFKLPKLRKITHWEEWTPGQQHFLDIGGQQLRASALSSSERGSIAVKALHKLAELAALADSTKKIAILTCPIDKHACSEAGFRYPGHTEFFSELSHCKTLMLLAGPRLKVGLVTNHLALADVSAALTQQGILEKLAILYRSLIEIFGIASPKIAVCGLNPHCSDGGLFGNEEACVIAPALALFGKNVVGPLAADTVFYQAFQGKFDAVLAMYHDQGLGPLKTVHFDEAVNISCGLPYLRVSPDHGPAKDLFLQNKASTRSLAQALQLAHKYLGVL